MVEKLYNYAEAAELLRIKPDTLQRYVASGRILHKKYENKRVFFTEAHLQDFLDRAERGLITKPRVRRRRT